MWKNIRGFLYIWTKDDKPGHAAVDGKVDGVGHADECVDEQDDVSRNIVVHKLVHTAHRQILKEITVNKEWKFERIRCRVVKEEQLPHIWLDIRTLPQGRENFYHYILYSLPLHQISFKFPLYNKESPPPPRRFFSASSQICN